MYTYEDFFMCACAAKQKLRLKETITFNKSYMNVANVRYNLKN